MELHKNRFGLSYMKYVLGLSYIKIVVGWNYIKNRNWVDLHKKCSWVELHKKLYKNKKSIQLINYWVTVIKCWLDDMSYLFTKNITLCDTFICHTFMILLVDFCTKSQPKLWKVVSVNYRMKMASKEPCVSTKPGEVKQSMLLKEWDRGSFRFTL